MVGPRGRPKVKDTSDINGAKHSFNQPPNLWHDFRPPFLPVILPNMAELLIWTLHRDLIHWKIFYRSISIFIANFGLAQKTSPSINLYKSLAAVRDSYLQFCWRSFEKCVKNRHPAHFWWYFQPFFKCNRDVWLRFCMNITSRHVPVESTHSFTYSERYCARFMGWMSRTSHNKFDLEICN